MAAERIKVVARVRGMLEGEEGESFIDVQPDGRTVSVDGPNGVLEFKFDGALGPRAGQADVYDACCKEVLDQVLNGYNGALLAYGQTASGKTHTMSGSNHDPGVIPRVAEEIFMSILQRKEEYTVECSYVQLYQEKLTDMLDSKCDIALTNDGEYVDGVTSVKVKTWVEMNALINKGNANRVVAGTDMNAVSSRSHAIFLLTVSSKVRSGLGKKAQLYLVDLAGSECVAKTGSEGLALQQAKCINLSLLSLRRVITALVEKAPHVPYRDSLLTRILENALGGNSKTCIIVCVSPSTYNRNESVASLRFGLYSGCITNVACQNVTRTAEELEQQLRELSQAVEEALLRKRQLELQVSELASVEVDGIKFSGTVTLRGREAPLPDPPEAFTCPLTHQLMHDPVSLSDGYSYERSAAEAYLKENGCPPRKIHPSAPATHHQCLIPNLWLRRSIEDWIQSAAKPAW